MSVNRSARFIICFPCRGRPRATLSSTKLHEDLETTNDARNRTDHNRRETEQVSAVVDKPSYRHANFGNSFTSSIIPQGIGTIINHATIVVIVSFGTTARTDHTAGIRYVQRFRALGVQGLRAA
jgi:hypothetical protein